VSDELYYPGWCSNGVRAPDRPLAIRFRVAPGTIAFDDRLQGRQTTQLASDTGDFVIRRRDGLFAYQLAVVVDDAAQNITHVVRGADLLGSTARQIAVQGALGLTTPEYAHLPVAIDANGIKLSKSTGAAAVDVRQPAHELWRTLHFLKQGPPPDLRRGPLATMWEWAIENWQARPLAGLRQMELT
jgi:glutamyl-Q tRNA(Asp) synthetase